MPYQLSDGTPVTDADAAAIALAAIPTLPLEDLRAALPQAYAEAITLAGARAICHGDPTRDPKLHGAHLRSVDELLEVIEGAWAPGADQDEAKSLLEEAIVAIGEQFPPEAIALAEDGLTQMSAGVGAVRATFRANASVAAVLADPAG